MKKFEIYGKQVSFVEDAALLELANRMESERIL